MSIKKFTLACLCSFYLAMPVLSGADAMPSKEELLKEMPEEYRAKFEEIYRLMRQNMAIQHLREQGMSSLEKADNTDLLSKCKLDWIKLREAYEPVVWGDFFLGTMILTGAYTESNSIAALYNPWWDAILLMRLSRNAEGRDIIQSFEMRSGESFRGESAVIFKGDNIVVPKDNPFMLEPVVSRKERMPLVWMGLVSKTVRVFDDKYGDTSCLDDPLLFSNGYDEESQTICGVRAVARLQLTREMLKNKGVMTEVLSWMKVLRDATPQQAAKLPLDPDEQNMFKLLVLLGPDFRKGITPYGYWGTEMERQYLFVCSDNPRLMMMVYVHVGKGLDFEWFDLNDSNKYLKLAAEARRNGAKGDKKEQDK